MCGICGVFNLKGAPMDSGPVVEAMTHALSHRGPDQEGFLQDGPAALGHCRLKIIDLVGGAQPMTSQDGRVSLAFNGEIYNFLEIRQAIEKAGGHFESRSDTESLLQLYERQGPGCLGSLEGMFAFAAYDRRLKRLVLAVDRFGKKPLYYAVRGDQLIFGSELKSLLCHPAVAKTIDLVALSEYLAFEYVPAPRSILEGVQKLEAGTCLEAGADGLHLRRYHRHDFAVVQKSPGQWIEEFEGLFENAVKRRLVSDVPLGVFLSGGLDSSAVLWSACRLNGSRKTKTFTIEFDDPSFDESDYARLVSEHFHTEHISHRCTLDQMLAEHGQILGRLDEPMADASFIPTFMLCRLAREHVTVALSGDGGDELFMGYPTFQAHCLAERMGWIPGPLRRLLGACVNRLPTSMDNLSLDFRLKQFFKGLTHPRIIRDQVWLGAFSQSQLRRILQTQLHEQAGRCYEPFDGFEPDKADSLKALQQFYFNYYLQGDILVKVDRASMANSLEVRSPLLDDRLVRAMLGIASKLNLSTPHGKGIFKQAMRPYLPARIIDRPKKGFGIPIAKWIRQDLKKEFERALSPQILRKDGIFEPSTVRLLLDEHLSGKKDNRKQLWTLYVFQLWKERYLS
ncbi:MAG: asparagine synthase (glutamine-hydrolyzing) [Candidatus Omnitrophota bacterium]